MVNAANLGVIQAAAPLELELTPRASTLQGYDDYIHAEHMYNITAMKNRKIKFALGTITLVGLGVGIPALAVHWTQAKRMA